DLAENYKSWCAGSQAFGAGEDRGGRPCRPDSLPELKPFLPWAQDDHDTGASRAFVETSMDKWAKGTDFDYAISRLLVDQSRRRGGCELGAVVVLTDAGFAVAGKDEGLTLAGDRAELLH